MSGAPEPMIVNCVAYETGRRLEDVALEEIPEWLGRDDTFVWLGLREPDEALMNRVQVQFGLHDLAVEDAHRAHQRPKVEEYEGSLFVVLRTAEYDPDRHELGVGETHLFVGPDYVVTVRHGPSNPHTELRKRCEQNPGLLRFGPGFVLYSLMDFIVDNYFPTAEGIEDVVEEIEAATLTTGLDRETMQKLHHLRQDILALRHALSPVAEIANRLMRASPDLIPVKLHPYFRDVTDHVLRLNETIDGFREILLGSLEANAALVSVRQNEVMKKLAAWAAIFALPTLVASAYGMNFEYLPGLEAPRGHWFALAGMAGGSTALWGLFRRNGWL